LQTINEQVQRAGEGREAWLQRAITGFPLVMEVEGIWITLMKTINDKRKDRKGRVRKMRVGQRQVILFALGCWPSTGEHTLLV
jgi:hypothetical protein